jgi:hypothetical protein
MVITACLCWVVIVLFVYFVLVFPVLVLLPPLAVAVAVASSWIHWCNKTLYSCMDEESKKMMMMERAKMLATQGRRVEILCTVRETMIGDEVHVSQDLTKKKKKRYRLYCKLRAVVTPRETDAKEPTNNQIIYCCSCPMPGHICRMPALCIGSSRLPSSLLVPVMDKRFVTYTLLGRDDKIFTSLA